MQDSNSTSSFIAGDPKPSQYRINLYFEVPAIGSTLTWIEQFNVPFLLEQQHE